MASSGEDAFSYSEPSGSSGSDASNESIDEYYDPSQLDEAFSDFSDEPAVRSVELPPRMIRVFGDRVYDSDHNLCCPICLEVPRPPETFYRLQSCGHIACLDCLFQIVEVSLASKMGKATCGSCSKSLEPRDVVNILKHHDPSIMAKYSELQLRLFLHTQKDAVQCPFPSCEYAVLLPNAKSCPQHKCGACERDFCAHCLVPWHAGLSCRKFQKMHNTVVTLGLQDTPRWMRELRPCPRCRTLTEKVNDGMCNHMICGVCHTEYCWLCGRPAGNAHFFALSGCTMFGSRPWSRETKMRYRYGTMAIGPLVIPLAAAIAFPAVTLGLPVLAARYMQYKEARTTRPYREKVLRATLVGLATAVVSPAVAALTILIGVPASVLYLYGVLPYKMITRSSRWQKVKKIFSKNKVASDPDAPPKPILAEVDSTDEPELQPVNEIPRRMAEDVRLSRTSSASSTRFTLLTFSRRPMTSTPPISISRTNFKVSEFQMEED